MEKAVVTGAAGFIGSHLCERLLEEGFRVTGVDSVTDYYDVRIKNENIRPLLEREGFTFLDESLNDMNLAALLADSPYVFHQAAQAGVRASWGTHFEEYIDSNIRATQRLLESAKDATVKRFVYASSSSVYGETIELPMKESHRTRPVSPYGVTKLAGENLCLLYEECYHVPVVALRYFTVYGPRQRPDMAFHKFIRAALLDEPIDVYGNGTQTRDFTFIDDIVTANLLAAAYEGPHRIFNIGGGSRISLNAVLDILNDRFNGRLNVRFSNPVRGDVTHTSADISLAERELGYKPATGIEDGLMLEADWVEGLYQKLGL
jgi:nucleoside-diphosphate-sugar epimerase